MKSLKSYFLEHFKIWEPLSLFVFEDTSGTGTSDNALAYRNGVLMLNAMEPYRSRKIRDNYKINKQNPQPGVIRWMKDTSEPFIPDSKEYIHRKDWDLPKLIGETELQLMHNDYYKMAKYISTLKPEHDILTVFQCSSKKPYYDNHAYKRWVKYFGDYTDFACISNPGIVPFEFSAYYPYRYDEWSIPNEEKLKEIIDMSNKYRIVNMCRFIKYIRDKKYRKVLVSINNPFKQWIFDEMYKKNIYNAKDWMVIVTNDSLRTNVKKQYPQMGGMIFTRMMGFKSYLHRYVKCMREVIDKDKLPEFNKKYKEILGSLSEDLDAHNCEFLTESVLNDNPKIMKHVEYGDFLKKFKEKIKDNMENGNIDKGENNLYYKSYYWTALDLLIMAMNGNLVEDIDKEYEDMVKDLIKDPDFVTIGDFVFCYKPLMKVDKVKEETIKSEAEELGIIQTHQPEIKLNPNIFE